MCEFYCSQKVVSVCSLPHWLTLVFTGDSRKEVTSTPTKWSVWTYPLKLSPLTRDSLLIQISRWLKLQVFVLFFFLNDSTDFSFLTLKSKTPNF